MCLIAQLLDYSFNLAVSFFDHFFADLSLCLNVLVLSFLEQFTLKLVLFNHELLLHLFDLVLMTTLHVFNAIFSCLSLFLDCVGCTILHLLDLFFETVVFHLKHLLNACVFAENCVLPTLSLVSKLAFEPLILLV